jgi:hypothetical protein
MDGLGQTGIADPVAALVLGPSRPVDLLLVNGETVVENGELRTADTTEISRELDRNCRRLAGKVSS